MNEKPSLAAQLIAYSMMGGMVVGVLSLLAGVVAFFSTEFLAAGVCLLAAGIAFGLLANAILRT